MTANAIVRRPDDAAKSERIPAPDMSLLRPGGRLTMRAKQSHHRVGAGMAAAQIERAFGLKRAFEVDRIQLEAAQTARLRYRVRLDRSRLIGRWIVRGVPR